MARTICGLFGLLAMAAVAASADEYVPFSEVGGQVIKVGDDGFKLRVTWYTVKGGKSNPVTTPGRGGVHWRPSLPKPANVKEHHKNYDLTFADGGLVRWHTVAQATGSNEFVPADKREALRAPAGAPGYAAARGDLKPGHLVEVTLLRPKEVPAAGLTDDDLRVKYVVIWKDAPLPEGVGTAKKK